MKRFLFVSIFSIIAFWGFGQTDKDSVTVVTKDDISTISSISDGTIMFTIDGEFKKFTASTLKNYTEAAVSEIAAVPDTSSLTPDQADVFINATKDTAGFYTGSKWALFFGGSGGGGSDGDGIKDASTGLPGGDVTIASGESTLTFQATTPGSGQTDVIRVEIDASDDTRITSVLEYVGPQDSFMISNFDNQSYITANDLRIYPNELVINTDSLGMDFQSGSVVDNRSPGTREGMKYSADYTAGMTTDRHIPDIGRVREIVGDSSQTYSNSGTTYYTNTLSANGGSFTIIASGATSINYASDTITIASSDSGENNTQSSSGSGYPINLPKSGVDLPIRSFVAGTNMTIDTNSTEITFNASGTSDDLGNHTMTENLQTDGNYISGDGGNEGIYVTSGGAVLVGGGTSPEEANAVFEAESSNFPVANFVRSSAGTNGIVATFEVMAHNSSLNVTDGFGPGITYAMKDNTATGYLGELIYVRDGADNTGRMQIAPQNSGSRHVVLEVYADGHVRINEGPGWYNGSGSPEGVVTAPVGSFYSRTDGGAGTSFYVKESGSGNTGWAAK